jgi:hypothetical protein
MSDILLHVVGLPERISIIRGTPEGVHITDNFYVKIKIEIKL